MILIRIIKSIFTLAKTQHSKTGSITAKRKVAFKKGVVINKQWQLESSIGTGGNATVWKCKSLTDNKHYAIKLPKFEVNSKESKEKKRRFIDEIDAIQECNRQNDRYPKIFDYKHSGEYYFYVMPLCQRIDELSIEPMGIEEKLNLCKDIIEHLVFLHTTMRIAHRDIKPQNILKFKGRYILADFGLAYNHKRDHFTKATTRIGARLTIAPEMERKRVGDVDMYKADIYSLAKTIWIILSGNFDCFEGQYSNNDKIDLNIVTKVNISKLVNTKLLDYTLLNELLVTSTDHEPTRRPDINDFAEKFHYWIKSINDFQIHNSVSWNNYTGIIRENVPPPSRIIWNDNEEIVKVLNTLCMSNTHFYCFYPDHGGSVFSFASIAYENDFICLNNSGINVLVSPKELVLETFPNNSNWNYYRIVSRERKKLDLDVHWENFQEATEICPATYVEPEVVDYPEEYGEKYELEGKELRYVERHFKGDFVLFSMTSDYNEESSTDDARHNDLSPKEFRYYIEGCIENKYPLKISKEMLPYLLEKVRSDYKNSIM